MFTLPFQCWPNTGPNAVHGPDMSFFVRHLADEAATARLGAEIAPWLRPGDFVALEGDLGAGKTVLARGLLRALTRNETLEVPSPTFTLVQPYGEGHLPVGHFDLYRLNRPRDIDELGLDDALEEGAVLVEWPSRLGDTVPADRLEIHLALTPDGRREATLSGHGAWRERLARHALIYEFIARAGWQAAARTPLAGDSSTRSYERLSHAEPSRSPPLAPSAFLMNWPQIEEPVVRDGRTYRQLAGLASSVVPFLAVGAHLRRLGLSVPEIYAADEAGGLLLLEDLGDQSYGDLIGSGTDMIAPYEAATAALARLHREPAPLTLPLRSGRNYEVPRYGLDICLIEVDLLTVWAWPAIKGSPCPAEAVAEFRSLWTDLFATLAGAQTLMLRDFHSPNLLWLPERQGAARTGIIDHQDAVIAHVAYDVVSLGQDARVDISETLEAMILAAYLRQMPGQTGIDEHEFRRAYAVFGAQRAVRLVGLFVRLARQDKKPQYLAHLPQVAAYLNRNLRHRALGPVKAWLERHLGSDFVSRIENIGTGP
ncbi:tRNA threonylcarbamoyladenosine biosynthesis protein TsaE [hydrothermal vent metagenome]|uniref:tRNA threonylcarbamoyladenosine biosynthesis protein TsaE n=1 Tax=hydrothermal vent metagenome TaxID=652676 RepID=A0A3B0SYW3_9ZZZZ